MSPKTPGFPALLDLYETRRAAIDCAPGEGLPDADVNLAPLTLQIVEDPDEDPAHQPPFRSGFHRKHHAIRKELQGLSELCTLHGLLIAHLRKRDFPDHAPYLFHRLWDEHADHLLEHLDPRWQVSAITTFGDHGLTATQRATGLALSTLFGMMKLYETERLFSGLRPEQPHPAAKRLKATLPMDMDPYALVGGGLDVNTLARLWQEGEGDAVIAPLAHHLLGQLLHDDRALFHRFALMRAEKEAQRAEKRPAPTPQENAPEVQPKNPPKALPKAPVKQANHPDRLDILRWGIVSTIKAPLPQIARFAAHHLDLGAHALHIYLDAPDAEATAFLSQHPKIHVTTCDADYWQQQGKRRPEAHQLRQPYNATQCMKGPGSDLHWLGHLDVDEFLLCDRPIAEPLWEAPSRAAFARIAPMEALAPESGDPTHFKLSHVEAQVKKSELQDIYPTFGLHLYGGFLSHTAGKVFARTGMPDTRLGIHALKYRGQEARNACTPEGLRLAHLHSPSWQHFRAHLDFRLDKGSYRPRGRSSHMGPSELFAFLMQEDGDEGLRAFFDEVCADTPALRDRLSQRGMLVTHDLDLDAKVRRVFGSLP